MFDSIRIVNSAQDKAVEISDGVNLIITSWINYDGPNWYLGLQRITDLGQGRVYGYNNEWLTNYYDLSSTTRTLLLRDLTQG